MIVPLAPSIILPVCSSKAKSVVGPCLEEEERERGAETEGTVKVGGSTKVEGRIGVADGIELDGFSNTMLGPAPEIVGVSGGTLISGLN